VPLPRKFMNFTSQNCVIWCILGVLFLRFMCPMDYSCMIMASRKTQTYQNKAKNVCTVFDLDGEGKFIKNKTIVIKEICSWLPSWWNE